MLICVYIRISGNTSTNTQEANERFVDVLTHCCAKMKNEKERGKKKLSLYE